MTSVDEVIGERVHGIMWRRRISQDALAPQLGIAQSALSRKMRGQVQWTARDVAVVAAVLGVEVADLMPSPAELEGLDVTPPRGVSRSRLSPKPNNDTYPSPVRRSARRSGIGNTHDQRSSARAA